MNIATIRPVSGYPCLVSAPSATPRGVVVFIHGSGEDGDGSDGQLAKLYAHGPLQLIANGVTWFDDNGLMVVAPQLSGNSLDAAKMMATIQAITGGAALPMFLTGLSSGGGFAEILAQKYPGAFDAIAPVAGANYPNSLRTLAVKRAWFFHNADDDVVPVAWTTGASKSAQQPGGFVMGWLDALSGALCTDTHPDKPTWVAHGALPHDVSPKLALHCVKSTMSASFGPGGWTWMPGVKAPTSTFGLTLYAADGHGGWDQAYGIGPGDFNVAMWSWFCGLSAVVPAPVPAPPKITQDQLDALAGAAAAVEASDATRHASIDRTNAAIAGLRNAQVEYDSAREAEDVATSDYARTVNGLLAVRNTFDGHTL